MTAHRLIREHSWVLRYLSRTERLVWGLQMAIAKSQLITTRRWIEGVVTLR